MRTSTNTNKVYVKHHSREEITSSVMGLDRYWVPDLSLRPTLHYVVHADGTAICKRIRLQKAPGGLHRLRSMQWHCIVTQLQPNWTWCMCDRESYMKMTRVTNLMQQLWFIIINNSTCFGHLYVHLQQYTTCTPEEGHTYLLTYSMEQSPSWEANWFCS